MKILSTDLIGCHFWEITLNKIRCEDTPLYADHDKVLVALSDAELEVVRKHGGKAVCKRWQKVQSASRGPRDRDTGDEIMSDNSDQYVVEFANKNDPACRVQLLLELLLLDRNTGKPRLGKALHKAVTVMTDLYLATE